MKAILCALMCAFTSAQSWPATVAVFPNHGAQLRTPTILTYRAAVIGEYIDYVVISPPGACGPLEITVVMWGHGPMCMPFLGADELTYLHVWPVYWKGFSSITTLQYLWHWVPNDVGLLGDRVVCQVWFPGGTTPLGEYAVYTIGDHRERRRSP